MKLMDTIWRRKERWIGHILRHDSVFRNGMKGRMEWKRPNRRKWKMMLNEIKTEDRTQAYGIFQHDRKQLQVSLSCTCKYFEVIIYLVIWIWPPSAQIKPKWRHVKVKNWKNPTSTYSLGLNKHHVGQRSQHKISDLRMLRRIGCRTNSHFE